MVIARNSKISSKKAYNELPSISPSHFRLAYPGIGGIYSLAIHRGDFLLLTYDHCRRVLDLDDQQLHCMVLCRPGAFRHYLPPQRNQGIINALDAKRLCH